MITITEYVDKKTESLKLCVNAGEGVGTIYFDVKIEINVIYSSGTTSTQWNILEVGFNGSNLPLELFNDDIRSNVKKEIERHCLAKKHEKNIIHKIQRAVNKIENLDGSINTTTSSNVRKLCEDIDEQWNVVYNSLKRTDCIDIRNNAKKLINDWQQQAQQILGALGNE